MRAGLVVRGQLPLLALRARHCRKSFPPELSAQTEQGQEWRVLARRCWPLVVRSTPYGLVQDACLVRAADKPKQRPLPSVS
jgi:hypothetical protein